MSTWPARTICLPAKYIKDASDFVPSLTWTVPPSSATVQGSSTPTLMLMPTNSGAGSSPLPDCPVATTKRPHAWPITLTMTPIWMVKISPQNQRSQSQPWLKLQCQYHKISHQLSRLMITTTWKMNSWWRAAQLLTSKSFSFLFLTSWAKKKDTCNASHVSKLCFLSFFYLFISYDSVL